VQLSSSAAQQFSSSAVQQFSSSAVQQFSSSGPPALTALHILHCSPGKKNSGLKGGCDFVISANFAFPFPVALTADSLWQLRAFLGPLSFRLSARLSHETLHAAA
jgi:hypothetical protein